jgi:hypothetical protein
MPTVGKVRRLHEENEERHESLQRHHGLGEVHP